MKHSVLLRMPSIVFVVGALLFQAVALAHETDEPKTATAAGAKTPETAEGIWQAIDAKTAELKKTIDTGSLADVHHEAYAVRDLVAALPAHSSSLPADRKAKVQAAVKFVATLAERLDASGDANDKASALSNYGKLAKVLSDMRANYVSAKP